jgi:hypothetical protein
MLNHYVTGQVICLLHTRLTCHRSLTAQKYLQLVEDELNFPSALLLQ